MKLLTIIQNFFLNHSQFKKEKTDFLMFDRSALNKELNEKLPLYIPAQSKIESHASKEGGGSTINKNLKLEDIFESKKRFDLVMNLLIKRKKISLQTHIWIDLDNGFKGVVIVLLKSFQEKGYYIHNHHITNDELMHIASNTFAVDISIGYIKHTKYQDIEVDYIPYASEIE